MKKLGVIGVVLIIILGVTITLIVPSFFTVRTGEIAAVRTFGVVNEALPPGLYFRFWPVSDRIYYDVTVRQIHFSFSAYSIDAQNVQGWVTIQYQLNAAEVISVAEQFGTISMLEQRLQSIMMQETQNVIALKSAMEIVETRAFLSQEIHTRLSEIAPQFSVSITAVALEGLQFSAAFENAVEQRMVAEQEMMQANFERDRAIVLAQQQMDVAAIEAEAILLKARADAEALLIMQTSWGELADAVKDAMLRQLFFESWNGVLPQVVGGDNLGLIMDGLN